MNYQILRQTFGATFLSVIVLCLTSGCARCSRNQPPPLTEISEDSANSPQQGDSDESVQEEDQDTSSLAPQNEPSEETESIGNQHPEVDQAGSEEPLESAQNETPEDPSSWQQNEPQEEESSYGDPEEESYPAPEEAYEESDEAQYD